MAVSSSSSTPKHITAFQSIITSSSSIISIHNNKHHHHQYSETTTSLLVQTRTTTLLAAAKDDDNDDSSGGGWYDDYDDFVQKLDFGNDKGWDSGADAPFDGRGGRGGGGRGRGNSRGNSRGGRGGGRSFGYARSSSSGGGGGGQFGHDYERDPNDFGNVDEQAVNDLLSTRLQYRKRKMFNEADDVRDELLNVHGVTVWDRDLMWTTQSRGGGGGRGGERGGGRGRGDRFDRSGGRGGGIGRMRDGGRGGGRGRGGRGGGGRRENKFNEFGHDYTQLGQIDTSICTLGEGEIHSMIRERMECKFARDFRTADQIEQELMNAGVEVHDGFKEWRADGQSWRRSQRADSFGPRPPKVYTQRGPGKGLSAEDVEEITAMVAERSECKAEANYARADELFDMLNDKYSVNVDDRNAEWSIVSEEYLLSPDTAFVPEEKVQIEIEKKLGERILARKARNFDLADDIREELLTVYLVDVDDRAKEWMVIEPEGGKWADDDDDDDDDETNIVSKEEWESDGLVEEEDDDDFDDEVTAEDDDDDFDDEVTAEEAGEPVQAALDDVDLSSKTVPQLKELLKEKGLPVSGRKAELIERLTDSA